MLLYFSLFIQNMHKTNRLYSWFKLRKWTLHLQQWKSVQHGWKSMFRQWVFSIILVWFNFKNTIINILVSLGFGSPCLDSRQCAARISGAAVCTTEGLCGCEDGNKFSENICIPAKNLGEECSGVECFDGVDLFALQCRDGKCICNEGYYLRNMIDCRPSVGTSSINISYICSSQQIILLLTF